jgi:peptidyl-prolyl cis-trans isomerase A (cyclophilin A)
MFILGTTPMIRSLSLLLASLLLAACGEAGPPEIADNGSVASGNVSSQSPEPLPDMVQVRLETAEGPILLALDAKRAPITTANFVRYVDAGRFDGTTFYRAAPTEGAPGRGFIQGGIRRNYRLMFEPIEHEPTSKTGIKHLEGTISMARGETGAMGDFFITTAAMPSMDATPNDPGYAAFGHVVEGLDVVRRILARPRSKDAGRGAMKGQMLEKPVEIVTARRSE